MFSQIGYGNGRGWGEGRLAKQEMCKNMGRYGNVVMVCFFVISRCYFKTVIDWWKHSANLDGGLQWRNQDFEKGDYAPDGLPSIFWSKRVLGGSQEDLFDGQRKQHFRTPSTFLNSLEGAAKKQQQIEFLNANVARRCFWDRQQNRTGSKGNLFEAVTGSRDL